MCTHRIEINSQREIDEVQDDEVVEALADRQYAVVLNVHAGVTVGAGRVVHAVAEALAPLDACNHGNQLPSGFEDKTGTCYSK